MAYANGVITEQSCQVACTESGGSCCVGYAACDRFTGLVRIDGSCNGYSACAYANIGLVVNSCVGGHSCHYAGIGGSISTIESSCHGFYACGHAAAYGGSIDTIENSCNYGEYNCYQLARKGSIGHILSSCSGTAAAPVYDACADVGYGEPIDDILSCCNGEDKVCCQSSYICSNTPLPKACASDLTVGIRGFARRFADE